MLVGVQDNNAVMLEEARKYEQVWHVLLRIQLGDTTKDIAFCCTSQETWKPSPEPRWSEFRPMNPWPPIRVQKSVIVDNDEHAKQGQLVEKY